MDLFHVKVLFDVARQLNLKLLPLTHIELTPSLRHHSSDGLAEIGVPGFLPCGIVKYGKPVSEFASVPMSARFVVWATRNCTGGCCKKTGNDLLLWEMAKQNYDRHLAANAAKGILIQGLGFGAWG
jgi:hypothetical protein